MGRDCFMRLGFLFGARKMFRDYVVVRIVRPREQIQHH